MKEYLKKKPDGGYEWVKDEPPVVKRAEGSGWPIVSHTSGVAVGQAQELRDYCRYMGVPTEVTKAGNPVYTSERHMAEALAVRGMCNLDGVHSSDRKV